MSRLIKPGFPLVARSIVPLLALAGLLNGGLILNPDPLRAAEPARPVGAVVLTVIGGIAVTNRPPYAESEDVFIGYHEYRFEAAFEFDRAMLEALGMHEATIAYDGWPAPIRLEGPLLRDILDAVRAEGDTVTLVALDGYAERIEPGELDGEDWILALRGNKRDLGIGQHGPSWLVYQPRDGRPATAEDEARWPWAVFLIVVE
ncbi:MAG: hypothetical protein WD711_07260 [Dongiaceae bacterium]